MTLEEKLRAYAAKGELVHLSLAFRASDGLFHCNFSEASPAAGYSRGAHADPVEAVLAAFKASPVAAPKPKRPKKEVTATVTEPQTDGLPNDWTAP